MADLLASYLKENPPLYWKGGTGVSLWDNVPEQIKQWKELTSRITRENPTPIDDFNGIHVSPGKTVPVIMRLESNGDPNALNAESGAAGLMQIMPMHFVEGQDPFEPEWNVKKGVEVLHNSLTSAANNGYGRDIQRALFYYSGRAERPWQPFIDGYWTLFVKFYKEFWGIELEPAPQPDPIQEALAEIGKAKANLEGMGHLKELAIESLEIAEEKLLGV